MKGGGGHPKSSLASCWFFWSASDLPVRRSPRLQLSVGGEQGGGGGLLSPEPGLCRPFAAPVQVESFRQTPEQNSEEGLGDSRQSPKEAGPSVRLLFLATQSPTPPGGRLCTHLIVFIFPRRSVLSP